MPHLFSKLRMRDVDFANRIGVSPMCQYSCVDGYANDWHFAHLASRAVGGAGLVFTEAAAVTPEGRISPQDLGAWSERHFEPLERIARFIDSARRPRGHSTRACRTKGQHVSAGRRTRRDSRNGRRVASARPERNRVQRQPTSRPDEMTVEEIKALQTAFAIAAERAAAAGFAGDRDLRRPRLFGSRVSVAVEQSPH